MTVSVALFTSDLRLYDNPVLRAALREVDAVVPLFVHDRGIQRAGFDAPNRRAFLADCLAVESGPLPDRAEVAGVSPGLARGGETAARRLLSHWLNGPWPTTRPPRMSVTGCPSWSAGTNLTSDRVTDQSVRRPATNAGCD